MQDCATSGRFEGRTHLLPVRIYYEDTDMSGIVYHANYLRYFERGRSDFLRLAGIEHTHLLERDPPLAFAITGMDIAFKRRAKIDDSLLVQTQYNHINGARLLISQTIVRNGHTIGLEVIATAMVEAVTIDLQGRPRRPIPELVTKLRPYLLHQAT
ncbi:YbgC/FadM family acyl-CoA thioesterase [Candidatus Phycosocius spiralis]|uniref:Tol-pal system-associated acyl-CoA thioesterase n=1 Tax=Candidatus Phycosocius spiralis TaxID=2815099 RepID=A0ABQ4PTU3_9PROT|nr:YbgC/FadM family acyl-CoA thioesterase [Candidatus Phycosocius spiralis]GIU66409.1 tol-pal system-associated acyl-CoA thioesterase [Candidatus Phycosocius spiralis]